MISFVIASGMSPVLSSPIQSPSSGASTLPLPSFKRKLSPNRPPSCIVYLPAGATSVRFVTSSNFPARSFVTARPMLPASKVTICRGFNVTREHNVQPL